jgi:hypothetical protein
VETAGGGCRRRWWGLYKFNPVMTHSCESAWFLQPLSLSSEKLVSKFAFKWDNLCRYTVEARFGSSALLLKDLAEARRAQVPSSSSSLRQNQNASNVVKNPNHHCAALGVNGGNKDGGDDDDEWMREMKLRVEARAATQRGTSVP